MLNFFGLLLFVLRHISEVSRVAPVVYFMAALLLQKVTFIIMSLHASVRISKRTAPRILKGNNRVGVPSSYGMFCRSARLCFLMEPLTGSSYDRFRASSVLLLRRSHCPGCTIWQKSIPNGFRLFSVATERRANVSPTDLDRGNGYLCMWDETGGRNWVSEIWRVLTRLMLAVCVCMMWCDSWAGQNPPTLAPGAVGWRRRWEGVRVLDWESRWEEGLQLYQRLVRWGKRAPPSSLSAFHWHVQVNSFNQQQQIRSTTSWSGRQTGCWV